MDDQVITKAKAFTLPDIRKLFLCRHNIANAPFTLNDQLAKWHTLKTKHGSSLFNYTIIFAGNTTAARRVKRYTDRCTYNNAEREKLNEPHRYTLAQSELT
jgi:hypothetical protein